MGAFLCLAAAFPTEEKDHNYLSVVVEQLQKIRGMAEKLNAAGWKTSYVCEPDANIICLPPKELEEEEDVLNLAKENGVDVGEYGFVEWDDDIDDVEIYEKMCGGDVHIDDADESVDECSGCCHSCDCDDDENYEDDSLMSKDVAEAVAGRKIEVVDVVEDYRVVIHLDDGKKLVYDEDDFRFTLVD